MQAASVPVSVGTSADSRQPDTPAAEGTTLRQTTSKTKAARQPAEKFHQPAPGAALLTDDQAARDVLGMSPRKFSDVMGLPWMPKPIVLGPRMRRWVRAELEAALVNAPRQAERVTEPAQLKRGKVETMKKRGVCA